MDRNAKITACAELAHEANRLYCLSIGDTSQPAWADAPDWQKASALVGVENVLRGTTPEGSHKSWLAQKIADGWKWGPVKDPEKKEHPCFMSYDKLPPEQQKKDHMFIRVVEAMALALDLQ